MPRVNRPPDDALFARLRDTERRLAAMEHQSHTPRTEVLVPMNSEEGGGFPGDWNVVYRDNATDHALSHIAEVRRTRAAWLLDLRTGSAGVRAFARVVIYNASNPYAQFLPSWQVLFEHSETGEAFAPKTRNVALPAEVTDSGVVTWNIAIHGKIPDGDGNTAGLEFWQVRPWAMILTDDPDFVPEKGNALV